MLSSRSWVQSANESSCGFPLANLPCGVFTNPDGTARCAVAIGNALLDVTGLEAAGLLGLPGGLLLQGGAWNDHMAAGPTAWAALRARLTALLAEGAPERSAVEPHLRPLAGARLVLPFRVAEFTDFYAGRAHALAVGAMLRGAADALPPAYDHLPIGYNGRASSVVVSGTPVRRPWGLAWPEGAEGPAWRPTRRLDFELELGAVVGTPSAGPVTVAEAEAMIFGYVLLNDWSARDVQAFEYVPLGPFQAKAFATTISPWIVTAAALRPFRAPLPPREVAPHLRDEGPGLLDLRLAASLSPEGEGETTLARADARALHWSFAQMLAHHASSGCPMRTGDLLGSGTVSGPEPGAQGCLLEITRGGQEPVAVAGGRRAFLLDGDTVTLRGQAGRDGVRLGFGDCAGTVLPALADPFARG